MLRPISWARPRSRGSGQQPSFLRRPSVQFVDRQLWRNKKGRGKTKSSRGLGMSRSTRCGICFCYAGSGDFVRAFGRRYSARTPARPNPSRAASKVVGSGDSCVVGGGEGKLVSCGGGKGWGGGK